MVDTSTIDLRSLCEADTQLKKVASTKGGEYAGSCPFCGGKDRFRVQPNASPDGGRAFCRGCGFSGDAIAYVMQSRALDFKAACEWLRIELPKQERRRQQQPRTEGSAALHINPDPLPDVVPDWQEAARTFCLDCENRLWAGEGAKALKYLNNQRYLSNATIEAAGLGLNPTDYRATWGETAVYLPRGIVIPWHYDGRYWNVRVRMAKANDGQKYAAAKGGAGSCLYRFQTIRPGYPVVMVEGEFDAMLTGQIAANWGIETAAVATGSITWSRRFEWVARLAMASRVLIAFDVESEPKKVATVESAAGWWIDALKLKARRLLPTQHDITDMVSAGDSVGLWLADALERVGA